MEIVSVGDLKLGMFVSEPDCPWLELPFALQGFVISRVEEIETFRSKCRFVVIDRTLSVGDWHAEAKRERDPPRRAVPVAAVATVAREKTVFRRPPPQTVEVAELRTRRQRFLNFLHELDDNDHARELARELVQVEPAFDELSGALQHTVETLEEGGSVDVGYVREGLRDILGSLERNADAVTWLLQLKRMDEYSFDHAMEVSVNMMRLGSHIGWRKKYLLNLGFAGLLQDVGKTRLPPELLAKTGALTAEERETVHSHVASSLELLYEQSGLPTEVMVIVSRHHERWDGSGYPRGLRSDDIGLAAEIAGLVDSFCAMLKDKPYRPALGHQEALEELYALRGTQFNTVLMEQFVQCIGLYPVGGLVELDSGEVGVVIQQNQVQRSRPRVLLTLDADKEPVRIYTVIDLREAAHADCRIVRSLPSNAYGLSARDNYLG